MIKLFYGLNPFAWHVYIIFLLRVYHRSAASQQCERDTDEEDWDLFWSEFTFLNVQSLAKSASGGTSRPEDFRLGSGLFQDAGHTPQILQHTLEILCVIFSHLIFPPPPSDRALFMFPRKSFNITQRWSLLLVLCVSVTVTFTVADKNWHHGSNMYLYLAAVHSGLCPAPLGPDLCLHSDEYFPVWLLRQSLLDYSYTISKIMSIN